MDDPPLAPAERQRRRDSSLQWPVSGRRRLERGAQVPGQTDAAPSTSSSRPAPHRLTGPRGPDEPVAGTIPDRRAVEGCPPATSEPVRSIDPGWLQTSDAERHEHHTRIAPAVPGIKRRPRAAGPGGVENCAGSGRGRRSLHRGLLRRAAERVARRRNRRGGRAGRRRRAGRVVAGNDRAAERGGQRQGEQKSLHHGSGGPPCQGVGDSEPSVQPVGGHGDGRYRAPRHGGSTRGGTSLAGASQHRNRRKTRFGDTCNGRDTRPPAGRLSLPSSGCESPRTTTTPPHPGGVVDLRNKP
jgi:hypothetical protein